MTFAKRADKTNASTIVTIASCCAGEVISLDRLPDELFPSRFFGDGFCMKPTENTLVCPVSGQVKDVSEQGHDITIKTKEGLLLIVTLGSRHGGTTDSEVLVRRGDSVSVGSRLWLSKTDADELYVLVVVTNCGDSACNIRYGKFKQSGQTVMSIAKI